MSINKYCPRSGKAVTSDSLTQYKNFIVGFCNTGCRDDFAQNISERSILRVLLKKITLEVIMHNQDKRVIFDFEISFSNGGGLQGQEFRLDIVGTTIEDDVLAQYIVKDLRLLMVGSVKILNKRIITEAHKRSEVNT